MSISDDNDNRDAKRSAAPLRDFGEEERKEFWAILALKYCKGAGVRTIARLLRVYGGAYNSVENYAVWPKAGIPATLAAEFSSGKWRRAARAEWDSAMKLNASILLWTSEAYPELLRQLPDAPGYLYCEGDLNLLSPASVAIVGSRNASTEGRRIAELLGRELAAAGVTVISGMASGIDACAHEGALREIGGSVGVLGTGIDLEYPPVNKKLFAKMRQRGLLLSEFSPGFPPINYNFPIRNRIISGLSLGVVVVEAAEKSGSLVTARIALEQNREVLAVPGTPFDDHSKGCQNLIRMGAHPVFAFDDILKNLSGNLKFCAEKRNFYRAEARTLHFSPPDDTPIQRELAPAPPRAKKETPDLPPEITRNVAGMDKSTMIMDILRRREFWQVDDLAVALDMTSQDLNAALIVMEIQGKIKRLSGANYAALD